jgi:hypothetical protein
MWKRNIVQLSRTRFLGGPMIFYKLLWLAAACVGLAHLILFAFTASIPSLVALLVCGLACSITYNQAWK